MPYRIAMIGGGSVGFSVTVAKELVQSESLKGSTFVLMDIDKKALAESEERIRALVRDAGGTLNIEATLDRREALTGADFIVTSYAPHRVDFWLKDVEISGRHGIDLLMGENGGPAGQIHALRNITIMMDIVRDVEKICPAAWVLNFTNPMSMLCTYLCKHTSVKSAGFCHNVHGSFGVIAEMLGMEPGDLQVISAGINHMNFLLDIRRRGRTESYLETFLSQVKQSPYWQKVEAGLPEQYFTLEFLNTFGIYPIGYDSHISEYLPFFYSAQEWKALGYHSHSKSLRKFKKVRSHVKRSGDGTIDDIEIDRILGKGTFPFPKDPAHPYYGETPVFVMEALVTGEPLYLDSLVQMNRGCVSNLPDDAIVDIPAAVVGGAIHGVQVGELPSFAAELCRRQIAVHELVVQAAISGDRRLFMEALCLDPYVHSLSVARELMDDYLEEYREYLPQFHARQTGD